MKVFLRHSCSLLLSVLAALSACAPHKPSPPSQVPWVVATAGNGNASLVWGAPDQGSSPITGYTVTSDPGGLSATTTGATTAVLLGLTNATTYVFTVHATNTDGNGPESLPSNAIVPKAQSGATVPSAPTAVVATAGDTVASILWTAPTQNGGSTITGYQVTSTPGGRTAMTTGATSATVTGLTDGTTYVFTVHAMNTVGPGPESGQSNAVTPEPTTVVTLPGAPEAVVATAGDGDASVVWTAPASGGSTILGYTVTATPGGATVMSTGTSAVVTGLTNGVTYVMTVAATNALGQGAGAASNAVTPQASVPGAPNAVVATAGNGSASLVWFPPNAGGSPISSYTVTATPGRAMVTSTTTVASMTGLTNGRSYVFTVHATNAAGNGPESDQSNAVTPEAGEISAANCWMTATPVAPYAGDEALVTVHLADQYGNPWLAPVELSVSNPAASLRGVLGTTNAAGDFVSTVTMGVAGEVLVTAQADPLSFDVLVKFQPLEVCSNTAAFAPPASYGSSLAPGGLAVGDFDRDGILDLAASNETHGNVAILLGVGDGTFLPQAATLKAGAGSTPLGVAAADLNGDHLLDLVVAENGTDTVGIFYGKGDGTFGRQVTYSTGTGSGPVYVAIGDLNGDGIPDLATANNGSATVGVMLGTANGIFRPPTTWPVGAAVSQLVIGDFNLDGKADITAVCTATLTVAQLFGNGDGTFQPQVYWTTNLGSNPVSLATADFNRDGIPDFAVADFQGASVGVFLGAQGSAAGTVLLPKMSYATGSASKPSWVTTGDFNGDGNPDIAVSEGGPNRLGILLGYGDGGFAAPVDLSVGAGASPLAIVVSDFNGDGKLDLAVGEEAAGSIGVFLNACTPADAGSSDAGDGGPSGDAGPVDAGPGDAGPGDAGPGDAGPGDAGPGDAGPGDAGPVDAGPPSDGGTESITLQIDANPNSVLSAIATVGWTGTIVSLSIEYQATASGQTPFFPLGSALNPAMEPVLGLAPSTSYTMQAVGVDWAGNSVISNVVPFTTGALPADVPAYTTTGADGGTLTLIARIPRGGSGCVSVIDENGNPVWYWEIPDGGSLQSDFQQQPDGTFTVTVPPDPAHSLALGGTSAIYDQVDVLGNVVHVWTALGADGSGMVTDTKGDAITILATDLHEFRLQPDGSALLFGYVGKTMNLSNWGGQPLAQVYFSVLERVGSDGGVEFAWDSSDFVTPDDEDLFVGGFAGPYVGMTHGNSIDVTDDGNYLVSFRNLSSVWKIDSSTGDVIWKLGGAGISYPAGGGPKGDFTFVGDPLNGFSGQHGVRELPNGDILLFDDGNAHPTQESRAVEYALDTTSIPMTATMVWESAPSTALYTAVMGFAQRLSNGDTLVDYGTAATAEEWDPTGMNVQWSVTLPTNTNGFYRAFRIGSLYGYVAP